MVTLHSKLAVRPSPGVLVLAAFALAAVSSGAGAARAALPGLSCAAAVVKGTGANAQKNYAYKLALIDWVQKVKAAYGASYAAWNKSTQRSVSCSYHPQPGQLRWHCSAYGRPCRMRTLSPYRYQPSPPARRRLRRP